MSSNDSDTQKQLEMTKNFLELSRNADTCATLRSSGCIQLLVQILHSTSDGDIVGFEKLRKYASQALHNIVQNNTMEKDRRREVKVLRLLEQILEYSNFLKTLLQSGGEAIADDEDRHPLAAISLLMKASFDDATRNTMCELGALKAIPNLVHLDHAVHGPVPGDQCCNALRRYALMALTNLTFGDENNKAYLCGQKQFMEVVVAQLDSAPEDLLQVTASVLRNLSWRADRNMKTIFNEIGAVTALAHAAMRHRSENTLKALLSALWNLSAHCSTNKAEFCAVDGALAFLVEMLSYEGPSKTLKIIENAGGILRNVSSHIAVCEPYRQILREHNCLGILLQQLKSDNMTVVSNSCGTLWNLSARCPADQKFLLDHGAIPLLRALLNSKNAMVAEGSASALKNLVNFRAGGEHVTVEEDEENKDTPNRNCHSTISTDTIPRRFPAVLNKKNVQHLVLSKAKPASAHSVMGNKCTSRDSLHSAKSDTAYEKLSRNQVAITTESTSKTPQCLNYSKSSFIEKHTEPTEEQPIDYSMKYNERLTKIPPKEDTTDVVSTDFGKYQEPDVDQPTDFSKRYTENQRKSTTNAESINKENTATSSEILLILDDGVKSSPDITVTPLIARAASANDLRQYRKTALDYNPLAVRSNAIENLAPHRNYDKQENQQDVNVCNTQSALETPLMFSRRSSMDSLVHEDVGLCDDNASVVSEYSRMQSGVISPSEIPDSPTQNMSRSPQNKPTINKLKTTINQHDNEHAKVGIFENTVKRYHVEHTPANFSCATSLSNLSILDDENNIVSDKPQSRKTGVDITIKNEISSTAVISVSDMNGNPPLQQLLTDDTPLQYCTEDTPALLSKACSNSNLSIISIESNIKEEAIYDYPKPVNPPNIQTAPDALEVKQMPNMQEDPITKMRCGGNTLPSYLPVFDEMNKYIVEDSPCNFSLMSGLSGLTIGSAHVGPAKTLKPQPKPRISAMPPDLPPKLPPRRTDSLSSLSIDSDDDTLSQAIAVGSGRLKASNNANNTNTLPKAASSHSRRQTIATTSNATGAKTDYDSSDSDSVNDGQSKSLFEQCIISGMHKSADALNQHSSQLTTVDSRLPTPSSSNVSRRNAKHFASLRPPRPGRVHQQQERDRLRRDDKLLSECIYTGITTCTNGVKFVSNQVRQIESMLANKMPESPNSNQPANQSRTHHWV